MKVYKFTITLEELVDDFDAVDTFYGHVNDASMVNGNGSTYVHFDREADSLDQALNGAIAELLQRNWRVREISVEPECVLPATAP